MESSRFMFGRLGHVWVTPANSPSLEVRPLGADALDKPELAMGLTVTAVNMEVRIAVATGVVALFILAACGGTGEPDAVTGTERGTTSDATATATQQGTTSASPLEAAERAVECLQRRGLDLELEDPEFTGPEVQIIYIETPKNSVEVWFHQDEAAADATADNMADWGGEAQFQEGTVVEDWTVRPAPQDRASVKECVSARPAP
jgi:hypothetical protein